MECFNQKTVNNSKVNVICTEELDGLVAKIKENKTEFPIIVLTSDTDLGSIIDGQKNSIMANEDVESEFKS